MGEGLREFPKQQGLEKLESQSSQAARIKIVAGGLNNKHLCLIALEEVKSKIDHSSAEHQQDKPFKNLKCYKLR